MKQLGEILEPRKKEMADQARNTSSHHIDMTDGVWCLIRDFLAIEYTHFNTWHHYH